MKYEPELEEKKKLRDWTKNNDIKIMNNNDTIMAEGYSQ
jgi:hypothetical protein